MSHVNAKRKMAAQSGDTYVPAKEASHFALVTATSDLQPVHSPANRLRASLEQALDESWNDQAYLDEVTVQKLPFAWTLIAMSAVCGAFWYGLASLIF
jgi:hypothetical protein